MRKQDDLTGWMMAGKPDSPAAQGVKTNAAWRVRVSATIQVGEATSAVELLAERSGLPKARIKDAMIKGEVWLTKLRGPRRRLRRATTMLKVGDRIELYYDADLLRRVVPTARLLADERRYSVWVKPAGLLAQGNDYGDHCALLRIAETYFKPPRAAYLVHRLDREAQGLMLIAHDASAAAGLSRLFQEQRIDKRCRVRARGRLSQERGTIELPLDDKTALTHYRVTAYDQPSDTSTLAVTLATGRLHQIRRHFALIGHPVLGDPKYGAGNKNPEGLQLTATAWHFHCPFSGRDMYYEWVEALA